jgi:uncharacterized membrane protein YjfL (UPF0719 family)
MDAFIDLFAAMLIPMGINYFFAIGTLIFTLGVIYFVDIKFLKSIDTIEEVRNGNIAVAIVISGIIYSVSSLLASLVG